MKKFFAFVAAACMAMTMSAQIQVYDVAEAIAAAGAGTINTDDSIAVRGIVTKIEFKGTNFKKFGSANIYVSDVTGASGSFEFYNCYSMEADTFKTSTPAYDPSSSSWAQFTAVADANGVEVGVGDTVIAEGKYTKYNTTYELNTGCYLTSIKKAEAPELETITVARAIELTMALDSAATSDASYIVEGYVVDAQDFSWGSKQQIFFLSDDSANISNQKFEAYYCTAYLDAVATPVLNGDKVKLTGKLTKYFDKNTAAYLPEIKNGSAEFISMVDGDRSQPAAEYITVADALAAGASLEPGQTGDIAYNIVGYVTAWEGKNKDTDGGWAQYGNQIFWIADVNDTTIHSNEAGAFEVYQGVAPEELHIGDKVSVYTKIKNYQGVLESETKAPVTILDKERTDLNVAQACEIALALGDNETTSESFAVHGYVAKVYEEYNPEYGNLSIYMTDDPESTYGDLQIRRAKVTAEVGASILAHDHVLVIGKLTNNYHNEKNTPQIYQGELSIDWKAAIENILINNTKINKVIVNGVVYIVRDGKMYNVNGAQVR